MQEKTKMTDTIRLAKECGAEYSRAEGLCTVYQVKFSVGELEAFRKRIEDEIILKTLLTIRDHKGMHPAPIDISDLEARIAEQQKELDDCKDAVVMLREACKFAQHRQNEFAFSTSVVQQALSATSAIATEIKNKNG